MRVATTLKAVCNDLKRQWQESPKVSLSQAVVALSFYVGWMLITGVMIYLKITALNEGKDGPTGTLYESFMLAFTCAWFCVFFLFHHFKWKRKK